MKMHYRLLLFLSMAGALTSCPGTAGLTIKGSYGQYTLTPAGHLTVDISNDK